MNSFQRAGVGTRRGGLNPMDTRRCAHHTRRPRVMMDAPLTPGTARSTPAPTREVTSAHQKAFQINLDQTTYGTFAEIGAGQEVARWFFRVGGAAGTIAKTMSAYDMTFSDAIYGATGRYVSRQRLQTMLDHEYRLLQERLQSQRGAHTRFFVFADTVAARSYLRRDESHGWMGIRFQIEPLTEPSEIIIHVRMLDHDNLPQQEAVGVMGVNLIHSALYRHDQPERVIGALLDDLSDERVEVDMIKFSGPAFHDVDNRLMSLQLVQQGLTNTAMFTAGGDVVQAAEVLYRKAILLERGSYRPVTRTTVDLLRCAQAQFEQEPKVRGREMVVLLEMSLKNLLAGDGIDHRDFLDRVDVLGTLGHPVLISNCAEHFRLAAFLQRYTKEMIGMAMGASTLRAIFDERYYASLEGGILEAFGRLFRNDLKLYVYPQRDSAIGTIVTAASLPVAPHLRHLHGYLLENQFLQDLPGYDETCLAISVPDVLAKLQAGDPAWEGLVPAQVAERIKERKLFRYRPTSS